MLELSCFKVISMVSYIYLTLVYIVYQAKCIISLVLCNYCHEFHSCHCSVGFSNLVLPYKLFKSCIEVCEILIVYFILCIIIHDIYNIERVVKTFSMYYHNVCLWSSFLYCIPMIIIELSNCYHH